MSMPLVPRLPVILMIQLEVTFQPPFETVGANGEETGIDKAIARRASGTLWALFRYQHVSSYSVLTTCISEC